MTKYIAFIRNILISKEGVTQKTLVDLFEKNGASNVVSYLSSGNLSFSIEASALADFITLIEGKIEQLISRREEVSVRTAAYIQQLMDDNPFQDLDITNTHEKCITFLPPNCTYDWQFPITSNNNNLTIFGKNDTEIFSVTRLINNKPGSPNNVVEATLGVKTVTRSWNIITKILDKMV